jgi:hypothetical protein
MTNLDEKKEINRQLEMSWQRGHDLGFAKGLGLGFCGILFYAIIAIILL